MWHDLTIIETDSAFLVAPPGDPNDWVARFEKNEHFPARQWAERMVTMYRQRMARDATRPTEPPPSPAAHL